MERTARVLMIDDERITLDALAHGSQDFPYKGRIKPPDLRRDASDGYKGTGLGLAIRHEIAKLNGGRVWVESEPGAGARFSFTLPLPKDAAVSGAA